VLSVVARLLGLDAWLAVHGTSLGGLLVFAAFFASPARFISLAMSKWMAKTTMGVRVHRPLGRCHRAMACSPWWNITPAPWASVCPKSGSSIPGAERLRHRRQPETPRWSR